MAPALVTVAVSEAVAAAAVAAVVAAVAAAAAGRLPGRHHIRRTEKEMGRTFTVMKNNTLISLHRYLKKEKKLITPTN